MIKIFKDYNLKERLEELVLTYFLEMSKEWERIKLNLLK